MFSLSGMKIKSHWVVVNMWRSEMKVTQLSRTLCDSLDYTVHGIFQVRILEWVAVPFSREISQFRDWTQVSCIAGRFFTRWTTREAQEYVNQSITFTEHMKTSLTSLLRSDMMSHWNISERQEASYKYFCYSKIFSLSKTDCLLKAQKALETWFHFNSLISKP